MNPSRTGSRPCITYVDRLVVRAFVKQLGANAAGHTGAPGPHFLPAKLESNLSELPAGYVRIVNRGHLILFDAATHRVVDSLPFAVVRIQ